MSYRLRINEGLPYDWHGNDLSHINLDYLKIGDYCRLILEDPTNNYWEKIYFRIRKVLGNNEFIGDAQPTYRLNYPREYVQDGELVKFSAKHIFEIPLDWNDNSDEEPIDVDSEPINPAEVAVLNQIELDLNIRLLRLLDSGMIEKGALGYYIKDDSVAQLALYVNKNTFPSSICKLNNLTHLYLICDTDVTLSEEIETMEKLWLFYMFSPKRIHVRNLQALPDNLRKVELHNVKII